MNCEKCGKTIGKYKWDWYKYKGKFYCFKCLTEVLKVPESRKVQIWIGK